jgi:hypothetical protein
MDPVWDGITRPETLTQDEAALRGRLADAARSHDWPAVLALLADRPGLVNACRPGGKSLYAPLHQAASGGAQPGVIERLLELGAWRTLENARGERPVDVATRKGHGHLLDALQPRLRRRVPHGLLLRVQQHFHAVIRGRAAELVDEHRLRLPELGPLLELPERPPVWFAVPGMYGGFSYRLEQDGVEPLLVAESWNRCVEGSGERHEITSSGSRLVEEGFV